MIPFWVINVILTLLNIEKYFINVDKEEEVQNTTLSYLRKNDQMNVALASRP